MSTPFDFSSSLHVGTVIFVSPDEIKVQLEIDAPDSVALNAGAPRAFPRINSYLLIPSDAGYLVGQVEWITIENSQYPKRKGLQDFGLIDLPFPMRKLSLTPLGTLRNIDNIRKSFKFERGVEAFPSVGDNVLFPTVDQLRAIVTSGENLRVKIGTSPLAGNADVKIDPDRLFGRHVAVLGNTGSGKSCSVAGLIRWSLEATDREDTNSRFIILDPNGEYHRALHDKKPVIFTVEPSSELRQLKVPLWFWNSAEWGAFIQASERAQKPMLKRALREIRNEGTTEIDNKEFILRRKVSSIIVRLRNMTQAGQTYEGWRIGPTLAMFHTDLESIARAYANYTTALAPFVTQLGSILRGSSYSKRDGGTGYNAFSQSEIESLANGLNNFLDSLGGIVYQRGPNEDIPLKFEPEGFADHLQQLAEESDNPQFFDFLIMRIRTMLADTKMQGIVGSTQEVTLHSWLLDILGNTEQEKIIIIDLSLVPSEVIHIITAVLGRMIFEALQRYRRMNKESLPSVLILEEAHSFIKRYADGSDQQDSATVCCKVFERIAREGRKFGLGLVLSSQRPSELSATVLSQCNTFLLHRISNDKDQELVHRLLPDNLRGLLRDLPTLPSRNAILLGWASELPVLVKMNHLPREQRPQSDDPDFWAVWTRQKERNVDWQLIADDWQGLTTATNIGDATADNTFTRIGGP